MSRIFRLRVEEVIALVFLLPTTYLTLVAGVYAREVGSLGDRHRLGIIRVAVAAVFLAALFVAHRFWPRSPWVRGLREVLPFLTCILIYTNLHDTIGFVNRHDVHHMLAALDEEIFGVQPCVWAERFVTPARTEVWAPVPELFWIAPSTASSSSPGAACPSSGHDHGRPRRFYFGYFLYILSGRAPPSSCLRVRANARVIRSLSTSRRGVLAPARGQPRRFPSLHAAVSLVAMIYAWRFCARGSDPAPFCVGLWASTIYLRHHFAVDLLAGWAAPLALGGAAAADGGRPVRLPSDMPRPRRRRSDRAAVLGA